MLIVDAHSLIGTRFVGVAGAADVEPGGVFTMGYLNSSLYTGNIEYTNLAGSGTYWLIPMTCESRPQYGARFARPTILIL